MKLNELARQIAIENSEKKGFNTDVENQHPAISIMLIVTELSEAVEADRNGRWCSFDVGNFLRTETDSDGHPVCVEHFKDAFKTNIKDTFQDEIADAIIRILDFCGANNIDIDSHVKAKLEYNRTRPFKHGKKY